MQLFINSFSLSLSNTVHNVLLLCVSGTMCPERAMDPAAVSRLILIH